MTRTVKWLILALGLVSIVHIGCQGPTLITTVGPPLSETVEGMLYYLPTGKITIKGDYGSGTNRSEEQSESRTQERPSAELGSTTQPNRQSEEEDDVNAMSMAFSDILAKPTRPGKPPGGNGDSDSNTTTMSGGALALTVTASVEPDQPAGIYYVTPQTNDIFEDEVQVTINPKHLLSASKVTTQDKTAEIVGTIASLVATGVGLTRGPGTTETPQPFCFSFDPSSYDDVTLVRRQLRARHIGLTVHVDGHNVIAQDIPVLRNKEVQQLAAQLGQHGLVFRPAAVYSLRLAYPVDTSGNEPNKTDLSIHDTEQFILPDRTKLYVMKFDRMPFVKKVREVGFSDGMLTDFHQRRPSPVLGFLGIPKAIVEAIAPVLGAGSTGSASSSGTSGGH